MPWNVVTNFLPVIFVAIKHDQAGALLLAWTIEILKNNGHLILDDYLFLVSNNSFLISLELKTGKIIYSYDLNEKISKFYNVKKRKIFPKNIVILSDNIYIFLENSYLIKFDIFGDLLEINKLPSKLSSFPIFVKKNIIFLSKKKKVIMVN